MKCKCGANLYRISGLTRYDNRDGIREAAWCDSCYTLFSSHAFGLSEIGKLTDKKKFDQLRARNAELEAEVARLRKALERLAKPLACGCKPCTGDCRSQIALEAELEGRIDFAKAALEARDGIENKEKHNG